MVCYGYKRIFNIYYINFIVKPNDIHMNILPYYQLGERLTILRVLCGCGEIVVTSKQGFK